MTRGSSTRGSAHVSNRIFLGRKCVEAIFREHATRKRSRCKKEKNTVSEGLAVRRHARRDRELANRKPARAGKEADEAKKGSGCS